MKLLAENGIFSFLGRLVHWVGFGLHSFHRHIVPSGLKNRFILIILLPLLLLQVLVLFVFLDRHWRTVSRRLAMDISGEIGTVAEIIQNEPNQLKQIQVVIRSINNQLGLGLSFSPNERLPKITLSDKKDNAAKELNRALRTLKYPYILRETENQQKEVLVQLESGVLRAVIQRKRFFSSTVYVFLIGMIGFSGLFFLISFLFMKNQVRAIERLSKAVEAFGRGQSVSIFKPEGAREVRQAGFSFLLMQNRIQRYMTERIAMLSGVSHDLRTPLTRMKLQLSMAQKSDMVNELSDDISEMEHMLEAYLSFARGEGKEQSEAVILNNLILNLVEKLVRSGQKIDFHQEQQIHLKARPNELSRAIMNILTNAGRYAHKTHMTIGIYQKQARIVIDDDGPGIPKNKYEEVFRAFYRIESSRNKKTGGIGLGLTISRDIILSHGGEIRLDKSPMGGLRVIIMLPISDD